MNILILGSGAREHSIAWKIYTNKKDETSLFCAPGNYGTSFLGKNISCDICCKDNVLSICKEHKIDFVIIGPELPLAHGVSDMLIKNNILCFGPSSDAAKIETSKVFMKQICTEASVPTASFKIFDERKGREYIRHCNTPFVIKKDGLAQGKGVFICHNELQGSKAIDFMNGNKFFIEKYLNGYEISHFILLDGNNFISLGYSKDYKRALEDNQGLNTGGMGSFAPCPVPKIVDEKIQNDIIKPIIQTLKTKFTYRGVLYFGLMISEGSPYLLEINARFGDPETQSMMPLLSSDITPYLIATAQGNLHTLKIPLWNSQKAVTVVVSDPNYPLISPSYLFSMQERLANDHPPYIFTGSCCCFDEKKNVFEGKGRIMSITGLCDSFYKAREQVYSHLSKEKNMKNLHFRSDICLPRDINPI